MTPLIAEMVAMIPHQAEEFMWFDIEDKWMESSRPAVTHETTIKGIANPLPFEKCALVGKIPEEINIDEGLAKFLIVAISAVRKYKERDVYGLLMHGFFKNNKGVSEFPPFFCATDEPEALTQGITIHFKDHEKHEKDKKMVLFAETAVTLTGEWLNLLNERPMQSHAPIKKSSHAKRIRQGKKPMFDWHTVVLEPRVQKSEYLGGTHSSPRLHDVRGHWVVRGSKRFWRKPHRRGDASKGVIFHDYKLKGEKSESISST